MMNLLATKTSKISIVVFGQILMTLLPRLANPPGHSVLGITSHSAVGLLGLLLFINILRVILKSILLTVASYLWDYFRRCKFS